MFDGDVAVAWCEYGTPEELPSIYHRKEYEANLDRLPDYRLTCFFVDKKYRRKGVAAVALRGALDLIAQGGGGVMEAYPHDTLGKKTSDSFLYNGTRSLFEQADFSYERSKGKSNCVMCRTVSPRYDTAPRSRPPASSHEYAFVTLRRTEGAQLRRPATEVTQRASVSLLRALTAARSGLPPT